MIFFPSQLQFTIVNISDSEHMSRICQGENLACNHRHKKTSTNRVRFQASDMSNMCTGAERMVANGVIRLVGGTSIEILTCVCDIMLLIKLAAQHPTHALSTLEWSLHARVRVPW
jgi:hypothetical protein